MRGSGPAQLACLLTPTSRHSAWLLELSRLTTSAQRHGPCPWCGPSLPQTQVHRSPCPTAPPAHGGMQQQSRSGEVLADCRGTAAHGEATHILTVLCDSGPVVVARMSACSAGRRPPDLGAEAASCSRAGAGGHGEIDGWAREWRGRRRWRRHLTFKEAALSPSKALNSTAAACQAAMQVCMMQQVRQTAQWPRATGCCTSSHPGDGCLLLGAAHRQAWL